MYGKTIVTLIYIEKELRIHVNLIGLVTAKFIRLIDSEKI